jgi:hypothetical protein
MYNSTIYQINISKLKINLIFYLNNQNTINNKIINSKIKLLNYNHKINNYKEQTPT